MTANEYRTICNALKTVALKCISDLEILNAKMNELEEANK